MLLGLLTLMGCSKGISNDSANGSAPPNPGSTMGTGPKKTVDSPSQPSVPMTRVSDRPANPNGRVFIAEYHHIKEGKGGMFRTVPEFKQDLERFYKDGFRPVTVAQYLSGKMPIPPGSSPMVFTFDDANPTQFWYEKDGSVDPNCAIGIWQDFAKKHPDFPIRATFYILPEPWHQANSIDKKLKYLESIGCEIGNHTIHHNALRKLSDDQVKQEIGGAELYIEKLGVPAPTSLAYPYGSTPKNKGLVMGFDYQGKPIKLDNALLVGAEPAPAPNDPKLNRYRIPRIQANGEPSGLDDWMKQFEAGRVKVYVQP